MKLSPFMAGLLLASASLAHAQVQLITADEAKLPAASGTIATRGVTRGPAIKIVSPDPSTKDLKGLFDLKIAFEPRGGAKIDPASVKLTYLKSPAVELTERIKTAIKPEGIELGKVAVPPGEHQIRVTVKDDEGRQTSTVLSLNVAK